MLTRVSLRLRPGRDDDLMAWINSLPERERSFWIRRAIRRGMAVKQETSKR